MDGPDLLLDVHGRGRRARGDGRHERALRLHGTDVVSRPLGVGSAVRRCRGREEARVEDVAALGGEALHVVGGVDGAQVRRGRARVCLGLLFFPAGVEELDCERERSVAAGEGDRGRKVGERQVGERQVRREKTYSAREHRTR